MLGNRGSYVAPPPGRLLAVHRGATPTRSTAKGRHLRGWAKGVLARDDAWLQGHWLDLCALARAGERIRSDPVVALRYLGRAGAAPGHGRRAGTRRATWTLSAVVVMVSTAEPPLRECLTSALGQAICSTTLEKRPPLAGLAGSRLDCGDCAARIRPDSGANGPRRSGSRPVAVDPRPRARGSRGAEADEISLASSALGRVVIVQVDPSSPVPVYEQIRAQIDMMIATGTLAEGTKLPTIRQLAGDLGVAKGTAAKAYQALVA